MPVAVSRVKKRDRSPVRGVPKPGHRLTDSAPLEEFKGIRFRAVVSLWHLLGRYLKLLNPGK